MDTVKDLDGGASLGFLGQELRPVGDVVASRPRRLLARLDTFIGKCALRKPVLSKPDAPQAKGGGGGAKEEL